MSKCDWLVPSIIATVFCFWPIGICAIYIATEVSFLINNRIFKSNMTERTVDDILCYSIFKKDNFDNLIILGTTLSVVQPLLNNTP